MDEWTARKMLAEVVIRHDTFEGYTHDIAADVLRKYDTRGITDEFYIAADERGVGPINWTVTYKSVMDALDELASLGGEILRFQSDGGIEFWPGPAPVDWQALAKHMIKPNESSGE